MSKAIKPVYATPYLEKAYQAGIAEGRRLAMISMEILLSLHKKVDVNKLSDSEWLEFKRERVELEAMIAKAKRREARDGAA